jgi:hypothetical protein
MSTITANIPSDIPAGLHRAELRGRAAGTALLAFFALGWTACGISAIPTTVGLVLFAIAAAGSLTLAALALAMSRRAATAPTDGGPGRGRATGRRYGIVVAAEWIGIFVVARLLAATGHSQLIPAAIALGVGIHFFPLAKLFGIRAYHLTGAAICLVALTTSLLAPLTATPALWSILPGFGSALTLYATCTHLLHIRSSSH